MGQSMEVSGTTFKHQETTKEIKMRFYKPDGSSYYPDQSHNFQAKVANATGVVGTYPVIVQGPNIILSTSKLTELPPDDYQMEVWETYTDDAGPETTIYPSPDACIYFTIEENIDGKSGTLIKELGFQDVVNEAVKQAGLNLVVTVQSGDPGSQATVKQEYANGKNNISLTIPKGDKGDPGPQGPAGPQGPQGPQGDKGDTGSVDNDGLINAPAFQTLQTQVSNSAVGTNLYTDTKDFNNPNVWYNNSSWEKETDKYNGFTVIHNTDDWYGISQYVAVEEGETYTYSAYAKYASGTGTSQIYWTLNSNLEGNNNEYSTAAVNSIRSIVPITDSWQRISATVTATSDGFLRPRIERSNDNANVLQVAGIKFEKGSVATDWCPNPSEILTQSDYAKIQAAIVALGGSL